MIHFIAKDLLKDDYVMDRVVEVESYRGHLDDLPDFLGTLTEGRLQTQRGFGTHEIFLTDYATRLEIVHERASVRDLLTRSALKGSRPAELWHSHRTNPKTPSLQVYFLAIERE